MIYGTGITTASGGTKATATRTVIKVTKGLVWLLEIDFPPGCVGLVHVQIFDGKYQLLPASPDKDICGDGKLIRYDDTYLKDAAPFEFVIVTWNEDELWDHTIQIRIGLASSRLYMARYLPSIAWEDFGQAMEEAKQEQEAGKQAQLDELLQIMEGG